MAARHIRAAALAGTAFLALSSAPMTSPALAATARPGASPTDSHGGPTSLADAVKGLQPLQGLLPVYVDAKGGRVLMVLTPDKAGRLGEYIYQVQMRAGLGSTPVGVDRAAPASTQILDFRRAGKRVLAELQNTGFRAGNGRAEEVQAVRESFPASTIWSGEILAEGLDGSLLIDLSSFLTRDAFGVTEALKAAREGSFRLAPDLSYVDTGEALAFPDNLEFEARQTFVSDDAGTEIQGIAPDARAVTATVHHALVRLPTPGFVTREADQRTGAIADLVADYGTPLEGSTVVKLAHRFRLEKTDPTAPRSMVKKPIIFYVDRAAPEPVRSALVEGARWWAQAFDAAGFIDAFKVEVLPEGVNPLDVRYNVINWVHRQTRGWSYGANIIDPRTGEILKGSVLLGSLRVRQDRMIYEGLIGADKTGQGGPEDPVQVALARLRQLSVHETGHAIGLEHNFAGSTFDDRASVMDYPPPRVSIVDGHLSFASAYQVGVGSWDKFAIRWLYSPVAAGDKGRETLDAMVRDGYAQGLRYVSDNDARPVGSAQPDGALWDDGPDPVVSLAHVMEVRKIALSHFGPANLPKGAPISDLRRVIVPVYLFHRYEVEAVVKQVGGVRFTYALRGDPQEASSVVAATDQRRALDALLATLDPAALDLSEPVLDLLSQGRDSPRDKAFDIELFGNPHAPGFDFGAAVDAATDVTLSALLEPDRLNRVASQGGRDASQLQATELVDRIIASAWRKPVNVGSHGAELARRIQARTIIRLASTLQSPALAPAPAAAIRMALTRLGQTLSALSSPDKADLAQAKYYAELLASRDGLAAIAAADTKRVQKVPPGMPIGQGTAETCWFCEGAGE